jgi:hypothetical protein
VQSNQNSEPVGRQQRRHQQRREAKQPRRRQRPGGIGKGAFAAGIAVIALALGGIGYAATHQATATPIPTEAPLAPAVDGIQCQASEMLAYHIHQHLTLVDHGKPVPLPSAIGIPGGEGSASCLYWIHVHAASPGYIHVESPIIKTATLGQFFDIWKATKDDAVPPGDSYVRTLEKAAQAGQVTVFYNGKVWRGNYRTVPLRHHSQITVEIGKPVVPPRSYAFPNGL